MHEARATIFGPDVSPRSGSDAMGGDPHADEFTHYSGEDDGDD